MKKISILISLVILSVLLVSVTGCEEKVAENGDIVKVHYTGTLSDGTQFDSSEGREPLEFIVGAGQMIQGFDAAVKGMKVGETKTVTIPAEQAYGAHKDELVIEVDRAELPVELADVKVGDQIQMTQSGRITVVPVVEVAETTIKVDANHRLAGKDLTFEIELVELTRN